MRRRLPSLLSAFFFVAAGFALAGCLTETEIRERIVVVGGPDSALLAAEGQTLTLCFKPRFGTDTLRPERKYLTQAGDSVRFETARFYVSGIALVDSAGKAHPLMGTHLVDVLDSGAQARGYAVVSVKALPGAYRGLRFSVGVPFDENHRDAATQSWPLGTESGMFWSWNPGYIFHRVEGKVDSAGSEKSFAFHVGADHRTVQANLFGLTGEGATEFTVAGAHHKLAALAKASHDVETRVAIAVDYGALFETGLDPASPLMPAVNADERQAHGGALADRIFLNMQNMFTLADAEGAADGGHAH